MKVFFIIFSGIVLGACSFVNDKSGANKIDYKNIEKHIMELSSDRYQGRMPLTKAEQITVDYIAGQMKEIGLEGANEGSYFQKVPLIMGKSKISPTLDFETPNGDIKLEKLVDYVTFSRKMEDSLSLEGSELVFTGFGITAPEYNRDDFQNIDLKGKTILVFVNDPGYGTSDNYFKGNTLTYYGRKTYKFEEAARRGAKACLIIHESGPAGYQWNVISNSGESAKLYLKSENGYNDRCDMEGWISRSAAEQLFLSVGMNLDQAKKMALKKNFKPVPLPVKVSGWIKSTFRENESQNVCGIKKGNIKPDEVIVYTAHWDHLGIRTPVKGDSIYNGAIDNASGVAKVLEIARAFKSESTPRRSVLFLLVTAEESGLLGSGYYADHPLFPMQKTVACINIDGADFSGKSENVKIIGIGQSELDEWVKVETEKQGRKIIPDPNPEKGMFFRSDQFSFAKKGVPVIFARGAKNPEKPGEEKSVNTEGSYRKKIYHTPFDEYHPETDDLNSVVEDAKLFYHIGFNLANSSEWPKWYNGVEFKSVRERSNTE